MTLLRTNVLLLFILLLPLSLAAQDSSADRASSGSRFSLSLGASAGNFAIDVPDFNKVYSNRSISRIYFAGIGSSSLLLIAKYREYTAHGTSVTNGISIPGKAEWNQKFYAAGLRVHAADHPIYADIFYVVSRASETIAAVDPELGPVEQLNSSYTTENKGGGFAVGVLFHIIGPIGIHVEGEYTMMTKKGRNADGRVDPELGGACVSAGVNFTI